MDDRKRAALKTATSEDWQHDAMTLLEAATEAGAAAAAHAGDPGTGPGSAEYAEQTALFTAAYAEAQIYATLAQAAATRELVAMVDDLMRRMP